MEINAANVPWHNFFFCGKPSFVGKKLDEKSKFGELSTEEIQEIKDNPIQVTTKKL